MNFSLTANPFLGTEEESRPAPPAVRRGANPILTATQLSFRDSIAEGLSDFKENPSTGGMIIIITSAFLYGILHAAGPGHRKTVVFSLFLAKKSSIWEPLFAGGLSAFIHSATALLLIAVLSLLSGTLASIINVDSASLYMEGFSFIFILLIALILCILKIKSLIKPGHTHWHARGKQSKNIYAVIAVTSIVPCPGTTMLIFLSLYLDLLNTGIVAVISMAAGMALVVSAAAYLAYFGREGLFLRFKKSGPLIGRISDFLELGSYVFLGLFALITVIPFIRSIIGSIL